MAETDQEDGEEIINKCFSLIDEINTDPCNKVLYHYTSAESFKGIVENHELWMTNAEFLNDLEECIALQRETDLFQKSDFTSDFAWDEWKHYLKYGKTRTDIYLNSFSSERDESLSQWRSYGNFRIGLDGKRLKKNRFQMHECFYDQKTIKDWILEKVNSKKWQDIKEDPEFTPVIAEILFATASKKYKNKYFKDEREYRMIVHASPIRNLYENSPSLIMPSIYYRNISGYNMKIPYVKFFLSKDDEVGTIQGPLGARKQSDIKKERIEKEQAVDKELLPITEVMVGPIPDREKEAIACEIFLKDNGYCNVKVRTSDIPYRGF